MPTISCEICSEVTHVAGQDWKYVDKHGPFLCSPECMVEWIRRQDGGPTLRLEAMRGQTDGQVIKNYDIHSVNQIQKCIRLDDTRSQYEEAIGEIMLFYGIPFFYESFTFSWGTKTYLPDFIPLGKFCIIEVKGSWGASQKSKYQSFRAEFPSMPMAVIPWIVNQKFFSSKKRKRVSFGIVR